MPCHAIPLHYIALHCVTFNLHYITLHYTTLHYIALHYTTLHHITLHTYQHMCRLTCLQVRLYSCAYCTSNICIHTCPTSSLMMSNCTRTTMNSSGTKEYQPARSIVVKRCQKCVYFQLPTAYRRHRSRMVHICPDYPPLSVSLKDLFALETIRRANHLVMRNHMESLNNKTTRHQGNTLQESTFKNSCVNMRQCVFQIV